MKKESTKEQVLMTLKKSRRSFLLEYICAISLAILWAVLYFKEIKVGTLANFATGGVIVFAIGSAEVSRLVHRCKITSSKLVIIDGLIKQSRKHIYISAISDIDVNQKIFQRLLNYGKIHIKSMSGEGSLEIRDIARPGKTMDALEKIIEKYKYE